MALTRLTKLIFAAFLLLQVWVPPSASRTLPASSMVERHEQWMTQFERTYKDDAEKADRFKIFKENANFIDTFNAAGNHSYTLAINKFTDMTNEEFLSTRTGFKMGSHNTSSSSFMYSDMDEDDVPSSIDWRDKGAVTDVKNQGQCGCCWAFAAVAATEGINQISGGDLVSLSEQELVDCDKGENQGCGGGLPDTAYKYIISNNGLSTDADYPYMATDNSCSLNQKQGSRVGKISGYEKVPENDENALMKAVANQPVSVGIDAGGQEFQSYGGGVFTGPCGTDLNHAVTFVGYGETSDGMKYWLLKNSWGMQWGESGYMKIQRGTETMGGLCGIAMHASYPTIN